MPLSLLLVKTPGLFGAGTEFASPSNVTATITDSTLSNQAIQLTFVEPSPTPASYDIQRRVDNGPWATVASATTNTTFNDDGLVDGIYQYRVRSNYAETSSGYKASNTLNAFINLYADFSNRYHVIAI